MSEHRARRGLPESGHPGQCPYCLACYSTELEMLTHLENLGYHRVERLEAERDAALKKLAEAKEALTAAEFEIDLRQHIEASLVKRVNELEAEREAICFIAVDPLSSANLPLVEWVRRLKDRAGGFDPSHG